VKDFATRGKEPKDEVQIYTWRDTTLREFTDLVSQAQQHLPIGFLFYYFPSLCTITFVLLPCTFLMHKNFYWSLKRRRGLECMWLATGGSADEGGSTCSKEVGCTPLICICISRPVRTQCHLECRIIFCSRSLCLHFYLFHSQSFLGGCYLLLVFFFFWGHISPSHSLTWTLSACKVAVALHIHISSLLYALVEFLYLDLLLGQRYFCLWIVVSFWISHAVLFIY
jgi:hypothetical protein